MAIGSKPVAASAPKGGAKAAGAPPIIPSAPSSLSIRQVPLLDPDADSVKPTVLVAAASLSQEPVAVFGGPVLAVCLASDTGGAAGSLQAALAGGTLSFLGWNLQPPMQLTAEQAAKEAAMAARYSGLASGSKALAPRLLPVGSSAATPCPSFAAVSSGCGVLWDPSGRRLAVVLPSMVHVSTALGPARDLRMAELCRIPLVAVSAAWHGSGLFVSTNDGRTVAVVPPLPADGRGEAAVASQHAAGQGSLRRLPLVIELTAPRKASLGLQCSGSSGSQVSAVPASFAAPFSGGSIPAVLTSGHLVSVQWAPSPASPAAPLLAVNVRSPLLAAALSLAGADLSSQAAYVGASAFAADCISRLPAFVQVGLTCFYSMNSPSNIHTHPSPDSHLGNLHVMQAEAATALASLGALSASLLTPCLPEQVQ